MVDRFTITYAITDVVRSIPAPVSSTNKTDRHDKTEILLKVALNTIKPLKPNPVMLDLSASGCCQSSIDGS